MHVILRLVNYINKEWLQRYDMQLLLVVKMKTNSAVFGTETPLSLQRAAFFFLWEKDFALEEVMNKDA